MEDILDRLTALETAHQRMARALRFWRGTALGLLFLSLVGGAFVAVADGRAENVDLNALVRRVTALEQTVARHDLVVRHFAPGSPRDIAADTAGDLVTEDVTLTGNLYIVNGLGSTATTNAIGNLIVGYNETGNLHGDTRTGSHNIVVGAQNSFGSYGGLVVGQGNTITGTFASVIGGSAGIASGAHASISGGFNNNATGSYAAVGSGQDNVASGDYALVGGGKANTASGEWASVTGGMSNTASNTAASVSGGSSNTANGTTASVSGGGRNTASGTNASVSGGLGRTASGSNNWAAGALFESN